MQALCSVQAQAQAQAVLLLLLLPPPRWDRHLARCQPPPVAVGRLGRMLQGRQWVVLVLEPQLRAVAGLQLCWMLAWAVSVRRRDGAPRAAAAAAPGGGYGSTGYSAGCDTHRCGLDRRPQRCAQAAPLPAAAAYLQAVQQAVCRAPCCMQLRLRPPPP